MILWSLFLLVAYGLLGSRSVEIGGMRIRANAVLVLLDTSGSMNVHQARKDAALARLRSAGISTGDQEEIGGSASNLLGKITEALAKRPRVDAIWMVSDFYDGTDLNSDNRYEQLLRLLRQRRIKLYLSTVDSIPHEYLINAARASGGDWGRL